MISQDINQLVKALENGDVVGMPTETVYGLAANAFDESAIAKIFQLKGRPKSNPLIIHIGGLEQMEPLITEFPNQLKKLADTFWPGPLTLLLPKSVLVSDTVTSGHPNVAIRMPNHKGALELLQMLKFPLVAPSANISNRISPTKAKHVEKYFPEIITLEGGPCQAGLESTIVGMFEGSVAVFRWGALGREEIEAVVGKVLDKTSNTTKTVAPGMGKKHYSPLCPLIVTQEMWYVLSISTQKKIGAIWFQEIKWEFSNIVAHEILSASGNLQEAGSNIYQAMHRLEEAGVDVIVVERLPETSLGISINDRLDRAAVR